MTMTTITEVTAGVSQGLVQWAHFADKLHVDKQSIDRVESAVLLSLIGGGLAFCVLGSAIYDIGRVFSVW